MGTFHMGIMLHFNNADVLSYTELLQNTTLPEKELTKQLQSLVEVRMINTEVSRERIVRCYVTHIEEKFVMVIL